MNYLHRLGFVLKRPQKRLLEAKDEERKAFVLQYRQIREEAQESGAKIFFVDEAHFRADADLRGKWVKKILSDVNCRSVEIAERVVLDDYGM